MQAQFKRYFPGISVCQLKYLESRNHFSSGLFDYSNRTPQKIAICSALLFSLLETLPARSLYRFSCSYSLSKMSFITFNSMSVCN